MSVLEGILFFWRVCVVRQPCVTTMEIADRPGRESIVVVIERASERDLKARPYMPPPIMIQTILESLRQRGDSCCVCESRE